MRPALDTPRTGSRTGARYLSPALVSSPAPVVRARLYGHPRRASAPRPLLDF
jgi:hypothetical protein